MSVLRDRVEYSQTCFQKLHEDAADSGITFSHYVRDNASQDGTQDWLRANEATYAAVIYGDSNIGISKSMNQLLAAAGYRYDIYVKFDNDCNLTTPGTLRTACDLVHEAQDLIVSPQILGLNSPPAVVEEEIRLGQRLGYVGQIGGIFMAIPGRVFNEGFRYSEGNPTWGMDDVELSQWFTNHGGRLAYLLDYPAWHHETTNGQIERFPSYWDRKMKEMGIPDHS